MKITDGDFVVITHNYDTTYSGRVEFEKQFRSWLATRGLNNVSVTFYMGQKEHPQMSVFTMSVNDVFENEVLNKGKDNG